MLVLLMAALAPQDLVPLEDLGLRVRKGFRVTPWSDAAVANDLYSMTLDPKGRVVVSSLGWIKRLEDSDGDGRADRAVAVADSRSGAMGLAYDGDDLLVSEAGGLWRHQDEDGDGVMDGKPVQIAKFQFGEHGHHAIRKGPDGSWVLIGGNDTKIMPEHVTARHSPVRMPETGGFLRYSPDFSSCESIAHGLRNPYDFDWNSRGDLFTYDSDCERDFLLPWYTPTRVYHVDPGAHHGWRLTGYLRSFARRPEWIDSVPVLASIGRGSPTGVAAYRHTLFAARWRDGLFILDWTFGRVWFLPLEATGATYETQAEVFLEPTGRDGFAPTDVCVAPDGALLVSIGGRRTRGGIYRIVPENPEPAPAFPNDLEAVLRAPQPLEAWSRASWIPKARALGAAPFQAAARDATRDEASRRRALEVLVELFRDLGPEPLPPGAASWWALGRLAPSDPRLRDALRTEQDPAALRQLLESLLPAAESLSAEDARALAPALAHPERRVLRAAALLASRLGAEAWAALPPGLGRALSCLERGDLQTAIDDCVARLDEPDALRVAIRVLGDYAVQRPTVECQAMYSLAYPVPQGVADAMRAAARKRLPDPEASRVLAMLEDPAPESAAAVAATLTASSGATEDIHALIVLSRLKGPVPPAAAVNALLSLSRKLEGQEQRSKQVWSQRTAELTEVFALRDPSFSEIMLAHPAFVAPGHVSIAAALPEVPRVRAAKLFLEAARKDPAFPWSEPLLRLLSFLPAAETLPALRAQWSNFGLRDSILLVLAQAPAPADREKFLAGIDVPNAQVAKASLEALAKLPRDGSKETLVPLLRLYRRLAPEPKEAARRAQVLELLARESGKTLDGANPKAVIEAFADLKGSLDEGGIDVAARLKDVPWDEGLAARGAEVFRARGCQTCHAVQGALGPNLAGAASRFSKEDLFEAIGNPSKDVAPPYRTTTYLLKDGQTHTGIVAFSSADGEIVQTGATTTVRLATGDIAATKPGTLSIMPNGLLDGLKPLEIADLYAYLRQVR